jgi:mono/diheme cytochrome c family protein
MSQDSCLKFAAHHVFAVVLLAAFVPRSSGAEPVSYNRDVRPILAEHCFACHGADSAARQADLRLDTREAAIDSGAIVEGNAEASELLVRVLTDDVELVMPPPEAKKPLSSEQKATLRRWLETGAEYQPHWSFIAPQRPDLPQVRDATWEKNPLDRFVLAKLEAAGLSPAPAADVRTLFRRLSLDLTGLPPAPADTAAFEADYSRDPDAALEKWIERFIQTPGWGEHRARYWLDAARYGDTHGLHFDNYREMWLYRDWVIQSFNRNQPFDQFILEQLAGDLLPSPTEDQLIATGFQRCNITTNEGGTIDEENLANYAADRVQTFGWVLLGLTTNCSQCHDHKFDPFTMQDYYSLAAYFRNTTQGPKDGNVADGNGPVLVVPGESDRARWQALPDEIRGATAARDARREQARPAFEAWTSGASPQSIANLIASGHLVLHLPLNANTPLDSLRCLASSEPIQTESKLTWEEGGPSGPALEIKPKATLDAGNVGDFELNTPFSYGAWIKPARTNATAAIVSRMDEALAHRGWDLWQNGRTLAVHLVDQWPDNGLKVVTRDDSIVGKKWQHVFVTYDGSGQAAGIKIFVDGQEVATRVETNTLQPQASIRNGTHLRVGQRSTGSIFEGAVQDVRVYGRALSDDEVRWLASSPQASQILATPAEQRTATQTQQLFDFYVSVYDADFVGLARQVEHLQAEQLAIRKRSPVTHIQQEKQESSAMAHILMRGAYDRPSEQVVATTPHALHPLREGSPANRLGLAQWVLDPANPLTARVVVNRFWQEVFGQGIVVTAEDFGVMGAPPSHPELMDWLAVEFQASGWDVAHIFKLMLMSATYRQAAIVTTEKLERDRDNILLSRGPRFRMDAEMVRDYALAASGLLSRKMYGPGTKYYQPEGIWEIVGLPGGNTRNYVQDQGENLYRRTVYTFWKRMAPPPSLETFNAPSREVCTVRRERTNTPLQALVTLNDPQFVEAARALAQETLLQANSDFEPRLQWLATRLLSRQLLPPERDIAAAAFKDYSEFYEAHEEQARQLVSYGDSKLAEDWDDLPSLAAWTMMVNQLMNLDEVLNK